MKKLWLLRRVNEDDQVWAPWYDTYDSFVVVSTNERDAREVASGMHGSETDRNKDVWRDPNLTSCVELKAEDFEDDELVIGSFNAA